MNVQWRDSLRIVEWETLREGKRIWVGGGIVGAWFIRHGGE